MREMCVGIYVAGRERMLHVGYILLIVGVSVTCGMWCLCNRKDLCGMD